MRTRRNILLAVTGIVLAPGVTWAEDERERREREERERREREERERRERERREHQP